MASEDYADLEISLHSRQEDEYVVEFRFSHPESEVESRMGTDLPAPVSFVRHSLQQLEQDPVAYGQALSDCLFTAAEARDSFIKARTIARTLDVPLRIRLLIGQSAPELHALHWETLRSPETGRPLSTSENLLFSRYLSSGDWSPVTLQPKTKLRALVMVANPSDLAAYKLAALDTYGELQRAQQALGEIKVATLPDLETNQRATIDSLLAYLRTEKPDLLYIASHGSLAKGQPWLWLEDENGKTERISATNLVERMVELQDLPRLVVLASCESAGAGEGSALSALGPRLAEAGVPAVIAMQGKISLETLGELMPIFFQELQRHGRVDQALAVARGTVRTRPDYWMPALFMRLKSGRIWSTPARRRVRRPRDPEMIIAPAPVGDYYREIATLREHLQSRRLLFFVGPDFPAELSGISDLQTLADKLAARENLPEGARMAEVAQQIMSYGNRRQFIEFIQNHWETTDKRPGPIYRELAKLIKTTGPELILTTAYHRMLEWALREAGDLTFNKVARDTDLAFANPTQPTLLKLYGDLDQPDTLVVTEQDLNALARGRLKPDMVDEVRRAFRRSPLLFLGQDPRDPAVNILFDEVAGDRFQASAYAVWDGLTKREMDSFRSNRGLQILVVDPLALVEELLA